MGIVDLETPSVERPYSVPDDAFVTAGSPQSKPPGEAPSFGATLGAAFRSENMIGSAIAADAFSVSHVPDPEFNTWEEIKGGAYEPYWNSFLNVHNRQELELTKKNIDRENEDRKILADAPWYKALPASLAANFVDPSIAIPGGAFVKGVKGGFSVAKSALSVGASAGAMATAQEAGLLATQQTRTPTESAVNIGSSTLLGMLLGGAGSALLSKPEWKSAVKSIDRELSTLPQPISSVPFISEIPQPKTVRGYFDSRGQGQRFHGSPAAVEAFDEGHYGSSVNYYGSQGFYTSDALDVAHGYANRKGAKSPTIYAVDETKPTKIYDMEAPISPEIKSAIEKLDDDAAHEALSENPKNLREWFDEVRNFAAGERIPADEIQEGVFHPLMDALADAGYHGMSHRGGLRTNTPEHQVTIYFNPKETLRLRQLSADELAAKRPQLPLLSADTVGTTANSLGAAANIAPSLAEMATAGVVARGFEKTTPGLNPHTRWANSPSPAAKELALNLAETTKYTQGNLTGIASPTAAETLRKEWDAGVSSAVMEMNEGYSAYRKAGGTLKRDAFENEVGMAMRRNDQHAIPEVQKAAQSWRKNVFEPAKDAAIEEKLLPQDVDVKTAASYFSRLWNRGKLNAEEHEFKAVVKNWAEGNMPRWQQDFDLAATEKIGKAEADFAKAKLGKDAGKIAETERTLNDLRTETRVEREARFSGKNLGEDLANEVFAKLTGRTSDGTRPEYITIASRGPLKERTFNIPDELVERWLESNINIVGRRYNRIMSADIELARLDRRMGGEGTPDLKGALQKVRDDYAQLRAGVTDEKELLKLAAKEKSDMRDLEGVRDIMRHTFELGANDSNWGRIVRMGNAFNYIRMMGNVVLASLGDAIRVPMVHGLSAALQGAGAALKDLGTFKLSVREARLAGNVNDGVLAHRLATFAEISDYTTSRGPVEKFLYNMVNVASHWNGIQLWTDSMKSIASVVTQNRILESARNFAGAAARDKKYLAFLGVDESMAARIAKQFEAHGETLNGVHVAGTENWTDDVARRTYRAALNKDVDSIVPTVGIADKPLMANTPIGRALLQFNMFNLAANQRIMLRGLQEGPTRFLGGVVALTTLGMLQTYLYAVANNRVDKLPSFADNPGWWIGEGLDRSGAVITVFFQMANGMEKLTGLNPIKAPMRAFDKGTQESERNIHRNLSSVLGPTAGDVENVMTATGVPKKLIQGDDLSKQQKQALEQLIPFQSYFGIRQLLRYVVNPEH